MKLSIYLLSCLLHVAIANVNPTGCHADNCARAVTGTRLGASHVATAMSDCSKLVAATATAAQTIPSYVDNCPNFAGYSSACSCWGIHPPTATPSATPTCPGANLLTDNANCGHCGNACPAGSKCTNGLCSVPECNGQVCGSFINCSPTGSQDCLCFSTSDGTGFCAGNQYCYDLANCNTTADCPAGNVCVVGSCCTRNVCLPATCDNSAIKLIRAAKRLNECTAGYPCE